MAQFAAGSDKAMDLWSKWVYLWPVLRGLTAISVLTYLVLVLVVAARCKTWSWIPTLFVCLLLSVLAFLTVGYHFPTA